MLTRSALHSQGLIRFLQCMIAFASIGLILEVAAKSAPSVSAGSVPKLTQPIGWCAVAAGVMPQATVY